MCGKYCMCLQDFLKINFNGIESKMKIDAEEIIAIISIELHNSDFWQMKLLLSELHFHEVFKAFLSRISKLLTMSPIYAERENYYPQGT